MKESYDKDKSSAWCGKDSPPSIGETGEAKAGDAVAGDVGGVSFDLRRWQAASWQIGSTRWWRRLGLGFKLEKRQTREMRKKGEKEERTSSVSAGFMLERGRRL